ncbi:MAG: hypothetical protein WA706_11950, partial [Pseudolabrys sp.]
PFRFSLWVVSVTQHSREEKWNLIENNSTLLNGAHTIGRPPKDCGCWPVCAFGRHTRPGFEPKVSGSGSQRVPLLTIMNGNGGVDAVINGGSKTV